MAKKTPIVCIMYDFDKTLCTQDMQNYKFIPDVGLSPKEFWSQTGDFGSKAQMEKILAYMYMMKVKAKDAGIKLSKDYLRSLGSSIEYYKGVEGFFKRINDFGKSEGVKVEHYIISSGIKEIIEGSSIAKCFKKIYACEFFYNEQGEAIWPKLTINYTQKTQFVFRISKGVEKIDDDDAVNNKMSKDKRRVFYQNMIYVGDGITDIPCMQLVKDKGGKSIAIYQDIKKVNASKLIQDERVNFICKADYSDGSEIDKIIKMQIKSIALNTKLADKEQKQRQNIKKENM